jgi:hypothetical protein
MYLRKTVAAGALLVASALTVALCLGPRPGRAAGGPGKEREAIADLKKRVARLEAEVAEMREALLRAGGGKPDPAAEAKRLREVATLRAADLLQRAQNVHAMLRDIRGGKVAGQALLVRINDMSNDLTSLWFTMAGYGLGRDPYLDNIQLSNSGFGSAKPPPDHGIPGPYTSLGLPRLHERFLEASGVKGKAAAEKRAEFKKLVQPYANPGVFKHHDFGERAYSEYRQGKALFTTQYGADLKALDTWLTDLEVALGKVPTYFERAP